MLHLEESCTAIFECQTSVPAQHCSALQDSEECGLAVGEHLCVISCCKCSCLIFQTCNVDVCSYRGLLLHGFIVYALEVVMFPLLFLCFFHSLFIKKNRIDLDLGLVFFCLLKKKHTFINCLIIIKLVYTPQWPFTLKNLSADLHNSVIEMNSTDGLQEVKR